MPGSGFVVLFFPFGFRVQGLGCGISNFEFRVPGPGFPVFNFGCSMFRVSGPQLRVQRSWVLVSGFGFHREQVMVWDT